MGKSQMRVTEPFRGNWARAKTADGSYKLTDWTHAIRIVRTQVKSTVQRIYAAFEFQVLPWMIPWAGWCKLASRSLHSQGVLG